MKQEIEFFYDFRSPYSYLAFTQLREMDVHIVFRPMRTLEVMEKVGNVPTTITCEAKGRYARMDLARWCQRYGIPLNAANARAVDGPACSRAVLAAGSPDVADAITLTLYRAIWSEGKALATGADILAEIAAAGLEAAPIAARMDTPDVIAQLDANTGEAAERGVFGAPTIFVGDTMFFGNDRLDFVREELARLGEAA